MSRQEVANVESKFQGMKWGRMGQLNRDYMYKKFAKKQWLANEDPSWCPLALTDVSRAGGTSPPEAEAEAPPAPPARKRLVMPPTMLARPPPPPPPLPPPPSPPRSVALVSMVCFGTRIIADRFPASSSARQWRSMTRTQLDRVPGPVIARALYHECGWGFDIFLDCRAFKDRAFV